MSPRRITLGLLIAVLLVTATVAVTCASDRSATPPVSPTTGAAPPTSAVATSTTVPTTTLAPSTTAGPAPTAPPSPPSIEPGERAQVISRGDPNRRMVALTFDAGADAGRAADILDTLAAEGITASFGITGVWAEDNPDLVARMASAGHLILNHTWDHRSFTGVSAGPAVTGRAARIDQLERTDTLIRSLTGRSTKPWFRPPFGDYDASVNADVAAAGYAYNVLWTVDSLGWQGLSASAITNRVVGGTVPGAIHLFHVGGRSEDATALPSIIASLRADGYTFGSVAEVIGV